MSSSDMINANTHHEKKIPFLSIVVTILIFVAVLLPGSAVPDLPGEWIGIDKLVHLLMFFTLALAVHSDFRIQSTRKIFVSFVACIMFSFVTEILQLFVEGRSFDLFDALFDLIGFSIGILLRNIIVRVKT